MSGTAVRSPARPARSRRGRRLARASGTRRMSRASRADSRSNRNFAGPLRYHVRRHTVQSLTWRAIPPPRQRIRRATTSPAHAADARPLLAEDHAHAGCDHALFIQDTTHRRCRDRRRAGRPDHHRHPRSDCRLLRCQREAHGGNVLAHVGISGVVDDANDFVKFTGVPGATTALTTAPIGAMPLRYRATNVSLTSMTLRDVREFLAASKVCVCAYAHSHGLEIGRKRST